MRHFTLLLCLCLFPLLLTAQRPPGAGGGGGRPGGGGPTIAGTIKGEIYDASTGEAVEYATIVLLDAKGEKQITGTISEADGSFKLSDVPAGKYQLKVNFIGYREQVLPEVETTPKRPDLDLERVRLAQDAVALQAVEVTGEAALVENRIDKLVYNAEQDATNQGGDASDVLRKVPLLSVDLEGNVSLRGSSNLRILINGRPSTIFATNVADALKSIPSDQIKSVEVITTPSARYDGEGSGGIINIITKKKEAEGFTGTANSSIGTRQNNAGLNLNALFGRFGLNGGMNSFWSWKRDADIDFRRIDVSGVQYPDPDAERRERVQHPGPERQPGRLLRFQCLQQRQPQRPLQQFRPLWGRNDQWRELRIRSLGNWWNSAALMITRTPIAASTVRWITARPFPISRTARWCWLFR